jgi:hypothetical protein
MAKRKEQAGFGEQEDFEVPRLLGGWLGQFGAEQRARGARGFRRGWVQRLTRQGARFEATVLDRVARTCWFELLGPVKLDCGCTCPVGEAGTRCSHVWAALLRAAELGQLEDAEGQTAPALDSEAGQDLVEQVFWSRVTGLLEGPEEARVAPFKEAFRQSRGPLGFAISLNRLRDAGLLELIAALPLPRSGPRGAWGYCNAHDARAAAVGISRGLGSWLQGETTGSEIADSRSKQGLSRIAFGPDGEVIAALLLGGVPLLLHEPGQPLRPIRARPEPWRFEFQIEPGPRGPLMRGFAVAGEERRPLHSPVGRLAARWHDSLGLVPLVFPGEPAPSEGPLAIGRDGWLVYGDSIGRFDFAGRKALALDLALQGP